MIPTPAVRLFEEDAYLSESEVRIVAVADDGIRLEKKSRRTRRVTVAFGEPIAG